MLRDSNIAEFSGNHAVGLFSKAKKSSPRPIIFTNFLSLGFTDRRRGGDQYNSLLPVWEILTLHVYSGYAPFSKMILCSKNYKQTLTSVILEPR